MAQRNEPRKVKSKINILINNIITTGSFSFHAPGRDAYHAHGKGNNYLANEAKDTSTPLMGNAGTASRDQQNHGSKYRLQPGQLDAQ